MPLLTDPNQAETIERKARHFVRWHPTAEARLQQLDEMATFAAHFNPQWKTTNMVSNATKLFAVLAQHNVRYLVIGGFAATIFGVPRFTYAVENTPENIDALLTALIELGSGMAELIKNMNLTFVTIVEFDDLPVKTDVLVTVPGLLWQEAWANRVPQAYQAQTFYISYSLNLSIIRHRRRQHRSNAGQGIGLFNLFIVAPAQNTGKAHRNA